MSYSNQVETIVTSSGTITFDGPLSVGPFGGMPNAFIGLAPALLQQWLVAAQTALHALRTGQMISSAMYNAGEGQRQVSYTRAQMPQLEDYVRQLAEAVYGCSRVRRRTAIGVRF